MKATALRLIWCAAMAAGAGAAISLSQSVRSVIALLVGVPSFVLMITSRIQLGASFSVKPESRTLVTTGIYSRIQHPMYLFLDLFLLAVIIVIGWLVLLPFWAVLVVIQLLQAQREEHVLAAAFGSQYESYRRRTWL